MGSILVIIGQLWYSYMVKPQWNNLIEILNRPHWCCPNLRWLGSLRPVVASKKGMSQGFIATKPTWRPNTPRFLGKTYHRRPAISGGILGIVSVLQLGWNQMVVKSSCQPCKISHDIPIFDDWTLMCLMLKPPDCCWTPKVFDVENRPQQTQVMLPVTILACLCFLLGSGSLELEAGDALSRSRSLVFLMRLSTVYGNYNMLLY